MDSICESNSAQAQDFNSKVAEIGQGQAMLQRVVSVQASQSEEILKGLQELMQARAKEIPPSAARVHSAPAATADKTPAARSAGPPSVTRRVSWGSDELDEGAPSEIADLGPDEMEHLPEGADNVPLSRYQNILAGAGTEGPVLTGPHGARSQRAKKPKK